MSFLGDKIAALFNPTPEILDPEDAVDIDSSIKVFASESNDNDRVEERSILRQKTAPLLEDVDPTYAGQKISRHKLGDMFNEDGKNSVSDNEESDGGDNSSSGSEESESEDDEHFSDDDITNFKKLVASSTKNSNEENSGSGDEVSSEEENEVGVNDDMTEKFSNIDFTSEMEKGNAIKNQKEIWNRLLETRIKLQKLLIIANKLPQAPIWSTLKDKGGKELIENVNKDCQGIKNIMESFVDLQSDLEERNSEMRNCINVGNAQDKDGSDEEIPSETDEEEELEEVMTKDEEKRATRKRKSEVEYESILEKRFKDLIPYRNSVIQKWDEKTRLSTGRMTQKSFMAFDNSALKQIEQILQDKMRLMRRTQLKRSLYRVLGKIELESCSTDDAVDKLKDNDYDSEIFDDDDFYRQILKDIIESKSFGMNPAIIRKQMEIQKIRNKMKRKVDTKASKGRKLRYDLHPKLVNFMAPVHTGTIIADEARGSFMKHLFGGKNLE